MSCDGRCCSVFNFPLDRVEARIEEGKGSSEDHFIVDMLVGLTADEARERAERFDVSPPDGYTLATWTALENSPVFTCRHWDEETRLCGVYAERPRMCQHYPYEGKKCEHGCGCSYEQVCTVLTPN